MTDVSIDTERPLFYRPEDAPVDYDRRLGDPGEYPFTRGTRRPVPRSAGGDAAGIVRELSGEGSAERSNEQFRYLLAHGATGLDVIGDAPTMANMDPTTPSRATPSATRACRCAAPTTTAGSTGTSRSARSASRTRCPTASRSPASSSRPAPTAWRRRRSAAPDPGPAVLRGHVLLLEPARRAAHAHGHRLHRLRRAAHAQVPRLRRGHVLHQRRQRGHRRRDGARLRRLREVVRRLVARGVDVDAFAPRIALLVNCGMDVFGEIAKIRAARRLYARMMREEFRAKDPRSLAINVAAHTSPARR